MPKEAVFTVKLESELRDAFAAEAAAAHRPASDLVRGFMREFVERQREARQHDLWFRSRVQEALDDPRASVEQDVVMRETRSIIDRIVASKAADHAAKDRAR